MGYDKVQRLFNWGNLNVSTYIFPFPLCPFILRMFVRLVSVVHAPVSFHSSFIVRPVDMVLACCSSSDPLMWFHGCRDDSTVSKMKKKTKISLIE
jgi:hypothetical protein